MTNDDIIKDLLNKIDILQSTINDQNKFIMRMVTYRDEQELQEFRDRKDMFLQLMDMILRNDFLKNLFDPRPKDESFKNESTNEDSVH